MKTYLTLFMLCINASISFGQIFTTADTDNSITISPEGVTSRFPNLLDPTNISLGRSALYNVTTGTRNIAIGSLSLAFVTTSSQLTAVGHQVLWPNTTGTLNSGLGANALSRNKTGNENTALGGFALGANVSLSKNVAVGSNALREQQYDGGNNGDNVAVGEHALRSNNPTDAFNGRQNVAVGASTLFNNTTGTGNTAIGVSAAYALQTGNDNVALGMNAFASNMTGSQNTAIGYNALRLNLGSGNVGIGEEVGINENDNNKLYISSTSIDDSPLIGGDFTDKKVGIGRNTISTANPNDFRNRTETLQVEGDAFKTSGSGSWIFPSDLRLKKNIASLNSQEMLQKVVEMQGVNYEMKDNSQKGIQHGFIAQDLREIFPSKIKENLTGYLSADYGSYDPMIVEAIKALNKKIIALKKHKTELDASFRTLTTDFIKLLDEVEKADTENNRTTKK